MEENMKKISHRISEYAKTEKINWRALDEIEVKVGKMIQEVKDITENQVLPDEVLSGCKRTILHQELARGSQFPFYS